MSPSVRRSEVCHNFLQWWEVTLRSTCYLLSQVRGEGRVHVAGEPARPDGPAWDAATPPPPSSLPPRPPSRGRS